LGVEIKAGVANAPREIATAATPILARSLASLNSFFYYINPTEAEP
jgi:hypothetical protein